MAQQFFVTATLGEKQSVTPEGFLLCEDVPIARTGVQDYLPNELEGVPPGPDGVIRVTREAVDVFSESAIASFSGKAFTNNHPPRNLTPKTWRMHVTGTVMHPRRGEGMQDNLLIADILVQDEDTIAAIRGGKREISCGYDVEYEILAPGRARQYDIRGNHVALVAKGRCGTSCAIGDEETVTTTPSLTIPTKPGVTWQDRARAAFTLNDMTAFDAAMTEGQGPAASVSGSPAIHVHMPAAPAPSQVADKDPVMDILKQLQTGMSTIGTRLTALETRTTVKDDDGDDDVAGETADQKAKRVADKAAAKALKEQQDAAAAALLIKNGPALDAAAIPTAVQDLKARAELIVPGIRLPAMDTATMDGVQARDNICAQRRSVLLAASLLPGAAKDVVGPLLATHPAVASMPCDAVKTVFDAASDMMRTRNNAGIGSPAAYGGAPGGKPRVYGGVTFSGPVTPAEINAKNDDFNAKRGA